MITENDIREKAKDGFKNTDDWTIELLGDYEKYIFQKILDLKILERAYIEEGMQFENFIKQYGINQLKYFKILLLEEIKNSKTSKIKITYYNEVWEQILNILNKIIEDGN